MEERDEKKKESCYFFHSFGNNYLASARHWVQNSLCNPKNSAGTHKKTNCNISAKFKIVLQIILKTLDSL